MPKSDFIPLAEPHLCGNEWKYIKECLDTNWVSSVGSYVERFEQQLARYIGKRYAVACVNGTAALHIALLVAGVKPEEEVIMPALTFVSPANAIRYAGAWPVFMDVQPDIWQMDPQKLYDFIAHECIYKRGKLVNRRTKRTVTAILPVHILGHPVDMDLVLKIAKKYNLKVIEDVAESLGAEYKGRKVGKAGDFSCFSFNGNKIITTGGGGMILTDNVKWAEYARYLTTQAKDDPIENIHNQIGYNYRLTNIQAAMGVAQLELLPSFINKKRKIAKFYEKELGNTKGISFLKEAPWARSIVWLFTVLIHKKQGPGSRDLLKKLMRHQIQARPLWHPIHRLKPFARCYAHKMEVIPRLYRDALSLPSSVDISIREQERIVRLIKQTLHS